MLGGAIPYSTCTFCTGVGLKHPIIILLVIFKATSTFLACVEFFHAAHVYSPVEKHNARAVVFNT